MPEKAIIKNIERRNVSYSGIYDMTKETIICLVLIVAIFVLDYITQSYTENIANDFFAKIDNMKSSIQENKTHDELEESMEEIDSSWESAHNRLAFFIEHRELEKVETSFVNLRSFIETYDYSMALSKLDETSFLLEHIKDRNKFSLENVF